jgi:hypothetical protein
MKFIKALHILKKILFSAFLAVAFVTMPTLKGIAETGNQQSVTVTGSVKSDAGELLPGVSIIVKGTSTGVITNIDGKYSITAPNAQSILVFSFVGMQSQEISMDGRNTIDVTLVTSSIGVDEVVVTALGIRREEKSLGYSVGTVAGEELSRVVQENVLNSMAGKVTGVQINQTGGAGSTVRRCANVEFCKQCWRIWKR